MSRESERVVPLRTTPTLYYGPLTQEVGRLHVSSSVSTTHSRRRSCLTTPLIIATCSRWIRHRLDTARSNMALPLKILACAITMAMALRARSPMPPKVSIARGIKSLVLHSVALSDHPIMSCTATKFPSLNPGVSRLMSGNGILSLLSRSFLKKERLPFHVS